MNISSSPIVMFAALLTFSCAAYSVEKGNIFSQNARAMDPIAFSQQSFNNLTSYQVMMRSSSPSDESKIIRYSFQKPGYVRMDFTQPHSGAVLIFNPVSDKVTLWPFGVGSLPILHLSPTNSLIQDERGHRVDRSDIWRLRCSGWRVFCIDGKRGKGKKGTGESQFYCNRKQAWMASCRRYHRLISLAVCRSSGIYHEKTLVQDRPLRVIDTPFCEQTDISRRE